MEAEPHGHDLDQSLQSESDSENQPTVFDKLVSRSQVVPVIVVNGCQKKRVDGYHDNDKIIEPRPAD